jgi:hypothetical protein
MAFGGGGARLTPILFYSAAAASAAAPIGLNEKKPKIFSVHGTIYTFQFSNLYNKSYKILHVIRA